MENKKYIGPDLKKKKGERKSKKTDEIQQSWSRNQTTSNYILKQKDFF